MNECNYSAGHENDHRQSEQETAIVLNFNSENRQMAYDCASHDAQSQPCAQPACTWNEEQDGRDQLNNPGTNTPPGLGSHLGEYVNRLRRCGEFEKECLQ